MAITNQTPGASAQSADNGQTVAVAYPASLAAGDLILLFVWQKPAAANGGLVTTPDNFSLLGSALALGGYGVTLGGDTGNTNLWVFYRTSNGLESGNLTVNMSGNNIAAGKMARLSNATGEWLLAMTTGSDIAAGNVSVTFAANPGVVAADFVFAAFNCPTDAVTGFSLEALTQTGVTFGTVSEVEDTSTGTGLDMRFLLCAAAVTVGPASAAPVFTATAGGTTTNARGPGVFVRVREVTETPMAGLTDSSRTERRRLAA